jgi:hypothetical protein
MFSTNAQFGLRLLPFVAVLAGACAGTSPSRQDELDRAFARIQVHEATIERQRNTLSSNESPCPERCAAADTTCTAKTGICELAVEVADADALTRCEHAKARCRTARATTTCACSEASE